MNTKKKPAPPVAPVIDEIDRDPLKLHPMMREAAAEVIRQCEAEALPFKIFEAWRSPQRQAALYAQGRSANKPGPILTRAQPWQSYHQFGLAADFVLVVNGKWDWDASGIFTHYWERLTQIGELYGLEGLSFEKPHLQIAHLELADLQAGKLPGGGDSSWETNLLAAIKAFPIPSTIT